MLPREGMGPSIQRSSWGKCGPLDVVILLGHISVVPVGACLWNTHNLGFCVDAALCFEGLLEIKRNGLYRSLCIVLVNYCLSTSNESTGAIYVHQPMDMLQLLFICDQNS